MAEHRASTVVAAPPEQVYALWSHFNDYPKFMSHVLEVTYLDDTRSHWVVDVLGRHEWDAVNEDWIAGRRIGWRATSGLVNRGHVDFEPADGGTRVSVVVTYDPPAGALGALGEALGAGGAFERHLQRDLDHFAEMVRAAPPGALDPTSSSYLFHAGSAAARGATTRPQNESMGQIGDFSDDGSGIMPAASTSTAVRTDDAPGIERDAAVPSVPGTTPDSEIH